MSEKTSLKLWLQLAKTSAALQAQVNVRFRARHNQSLARFDVLSQLARAPGQSLNVGALSQALIASPGNISRLLDRMQSDGLIKRQASAVDRRSIAVKITPKGSALFDEMAEDHANWINALLSGQSETQQQNLHSALVDLHNVLPQKPD